MSRWQKARAFLKDENYTIIGFYHQIYFDAILVDVKNRISHKTSSCLCIQGYSGFRTLLKGGLGIYNHPIKQFLEEREMMVCKPRGGEA